MLYPAPNLIDVFLGKAVTPPKPAKITVRLASGEQISGTLVHQDEFWVSMRDAAGSYRSFSRTNVTVEVQDEEGNVGSQSSDLIRGKPDPSLASGSGCASCAVSSIRPSSR